MADMQVIPETPPEMELPEVLPYFKDFLGQLVEAFTDADEESVQSAFNNDKNAKTLLDFLEPSIVNYLILCFEPKNKKLRVASDVKGLRAGQCIGVFRRAPFSFPKGCAVPTVLHTNVNSINLGEIEDQFNPVSIANSSLQNCFQPLLKDAEESKDVIVNSNQTKQTISTNFVKSQSTIDAIQRQFADLNFAMVQHTALKAIPDVTYNFDTYIIQACEKAQKAGREPAVSDIPEEVLKKDNWINNINDGLVSWANLINILFKHWQEVTFDSLAQEIEYWAKYQAAVIKVVEMLKRPEVQLSLKIVSMKVKRSNLDFSEIVSAPKQLELVNSVNAIIRDIQFDKLDQAKSISEISSAMINIFNQMKKLLDNNNYTPAKIASMLHNFSQDLTNKLISFYKPLDVLRMPAKEFDAILTDHNRLITGIFTTQNNQMKTYLSQAAGHTTFAAGISKLKFNKLNERLKNLQTYKQTQESFQKIVQQINAQDDSLGEKAKGLVTITEVEIQEIFNNAFSIDIYDLTPEGDVALEHAKKKYDEKIDAIEKQILIKIRSLLGSAKNHNEMFQIFAKFTEILKRPQFQASLSEYQDQFLKKIYENSSDLYAKYKKKANDAGAKDICRYYGLYPSAGSIVRFDQAFSHFTTNRQKIETVMGDKLKSWSKEQELETINSNFQRAKENEEAAKKPSITEKDLDGRLLTIEAMPRSNLLKLAVNFSEQNRNAIEDMRFLIKNKQFGAVNLTTVYYFKKNTLAVYFNALKLFEIVKVWNHVVQKIDEKSSMLTMLLSNQFKKVYACIEQGLKLDWITQADRAQEREAYLARFLDSVLVLEGAVDHVGENLQRIDEHIKALAGSEADFEEFQKSIAAIQDIIDELLLKEYTNTEQIVKEINSRIERAFLKRLAETLTTWTDEFAKYKNEPRSKTKNKLVRVPTTFEFSVRGTKIFIEPPIQQARLTWLNDLHSRIHTFTCQKKILVNRYHQPSNARGGELSDFTDLLSKLPPATIANAYKALHEKVNAAESYVKRWLSYEALWDIDIRRFYERFGTNLKTWQQVLSEIKAGRNTFDTSQVSTNYGPIVINYKAVQNKINNVYDSLHKQVLTEFGNKFVSNAADIQNKVFEYKSKLEKLNFGSAADLVDNIAVMKFCAQNIERWRQDIEQAGDVERLLLQQKYHFPEDYKSSGSIGKDFARFQQIYEQKSQQFEGNIEAFKVNLSKEEESIGKKTAEIEYTWNTKKPFAPEMNAREAMDTIASLEKTIQENQAALGKLNQAKELIGMQTVEADAMNTIVEDLATLKELWGLVGKVWEPLDAVFDTPFNSCNTTQQNKVFDQMGEALQDAAPRLKTHPIIVGKRKEIQILKRKNRMISDIKTEAIKDHHLEEILKRLNIRKAAPDVLVRDLFSLNLDQHEKAINEIVAMAQGELVLENMLKKIKTFWNEERFQTSKYQNKTMLIKGWDDMMTRAEEDIGQLTSMKLSQHFKTFETDIKSWHEKITTVSNTLSVWMDVQRKWVYLENIFLGSSDIKSQLASEYDRFQTIDRDFINIMKQMAAKQRILEVILTIPNLLKSLEYISETLDKLQKSLTDYLESQRQAFPRFYFVGDDDLLEIIGNSKEIGNVQKYFSKMFAGINSVDNEDHGDTLVGMVSKENEKVAFDHRIKISGYAKINLWLTELVNQMQLSLSTLLEQSVQGWKDSNPKTLRPLVEKYPTQTILLALQTYWTFMIEEQLGKKLSTGPVVKILIGYLAQMAEEVLGHLDTLTRKRYEQLITEMVHKRDVSRRLEELHQPKLTDFSWCYYMRFYMTMSERNPVNRLKVCMGNSEFVYGHEYLGITDKLVQTPLTDKCYFTLTQALWLRMGGAPFGPAGTGKTESVKALGCNLGRFVLVFNCDETFNFKAMGRIFIGLCQVGAWGCFDEFNRLEERILSAVSQTILTIQTGLRENNLKVELLGRAVTLNVNLGIFVTMNPGYAGRSNLPENLKQLFRQMAMIKPDSVLIAQVMLFSQGFKSAEELSGKVVSLFELCADQLSSQPHYDFGLRALKSVLNSAGNLKRRVMAEAGPESNPHSLENEQLIILRSFSDTVVPKLVSDDAPLLRLLIKGIFPTANVPPIENAELLTHLKSECDRRFLLYSNEKFIEKTLQLNQILKLQHGVMLVGPTGCGKTAAWKSLLSALTKLDGVKGESYIIDPKAITKDELYGKLDNTTMEWTDGIFTYIIRRICENQRGESAKRHWIVFDGDVDPEWAENLNSVLDDNKLLTLPNGERLPILSNVKIMFEVESLKYATLATVSRCGMAWFSEDILEDQHIYHHYLMRLKEDNYDSLVSSGIAAVPTDASNLRERCVDYIKPLFIREGTDHKSPVSIALDVASRQAHVMEYSRIRLLEALFALVRKGVDRVIEYDETRFGNFQNEHAIIEKYMLNWTMFAVNWSFAGDLKLHERATYFQELKASLVELPPALVWPDIDSMKTLIDYEVKVEDGEWSLWKLKVPELALPSEKVTNADTIIPTVDTLRHQEVLCSWLLEHRPFIICGPPGSGKTMTLMSTLKNLQDFEMIFVNFSSSTTPTLILKQFEHYCEYSKAATGITLRPRTPNKWLVVFCDEINLPDEDKYGTQSVITLLRQMTEQHGFWRCSDKQWVSLERIQFVGACNPPTDAGRHPLSPRFLRHCPLILVDFPGYDSLIQIYGTFNKAMLKRAPALKPYADALTTAMVEYYSESQRQFTADQQPHYIYSPRDLTRWKYAINEALDHLNSVDDLIRLWAHEALRLFEDRLVTAEEKKWCQEKIDVIADRNFPGHDASALVRPIIFSTYITKAYTSVKLDEIREYIIGKLQVFNEEEYAVQLVVFDEVVEHISKIDRVLRQPIGHMLLVGASGVGKTTLSRFVSWINGLKVFQIKAGRNYSLQNFDEDLRSVMKRAGCRGENITFIFDESNVLSVAFMERMNALLASGEIPGLFEGDEFYALINAYKEAQGASKVRETEDEIYQRFIKNVQKNLHVVFTMNPQSDDFSNRAASSPAIFNRCVIDWFGDWSEQALHQVAKELTEDIVYSPGIEHGTIVDLIVRIHKSVCRLNEKLRASGKKFNYMTPRDYLDFIRHFKNLAAEKRSDLTEQQTHLNNGLSSLKNTEVRVSELKVNLAKYDLELEAKKAEADKKLEIIMQQQRESNKQIETSTKLKEQIAVKQKEIDASQKIVQGQLDAVGPALENAKKAVQGITPKELGEIKAYANPSPKIVLTMEAVLLLIQAKKMEWAAIRTEMMKPDFIPTILRFDIDKVPESVKARLRKDYLGHPEWSVEAIYKSSKAAGPLADWVESQLKYADILNQVKPLRDQIDDMNKNSQALKDQAIELENNIQRLNESIEQYKRELSDLISMTTSLKNEKQAVQSKLIKAENLLGGLKSEKERWEKSSKEFVNQFKTLTGDVLVSSAFLAYIGFFDQFYREQLMLTWKGYLKQSKITFTQELSAIEYLSLPSERIKWQAKGLPNDNICVQNAIVLKRFNRYPLIIDPSAQAIDFIVNLYKEDGPVGDKVPKTLIRTSFIDDSFMKQLETSLRFGLPILIQDVEKIEPILNTILNKEIIKTGGRNLIRVGDQEVDFAPDFRLFMITRNPDAHFTPDLCSRVTFVNFTVTQASLENQFINIYLRNERPDVERNRINLLKLQGEFTVQLRGLEDELLAELSKSEGTNILDNDEMIQKLERIKKQATEIEAEKAESEVNLEKNTVVTEQYRALARVSSKLYFILESMAQVSTLYQFSLKFYMRIVFQILQSNKRLEAVPRNEYEERIKLLDELLYTKVYERVSVSVLEKDKFLFGLKFVQTRLESNYPHELLELFSLLYLPVKLVETTLSDDMFDRLLSKAAMIKFEDLAGRDGFENLLPHVQRNKTHWLEFIRNKNLRGLEDYSFYALEKLEKHAEKTPHLMDISKVILEILIFNIVRVESTYAKIKDLIDAVFGKAFLNSDAMNLQEAVIDDGEAKSPVFFSSAPGFDPSGKIYELAKSAGKKYDDVALGSQEGFDLAKRALADATKHGNWVILKNVHLSPSWLKELEQDLYGMNPHKNFRLFLLAEFSDKIPATLLKQSLKFIFELPDGIKASVRRTYKLILDPKKSDKLPLERARLHFLLAWTHAVIMERLRYTPTGWSKKYEFSEADLRCALEIVDEYVNLQGQKQNLAIEDIPFEALTSIITENIYGGKVDNQYDLKILQSIIYQYLTVDSFDPKKSLVQDRTNPVLNPDAVSFLDFKNWIDGLEKEETPVWAGLPLSANDILNTQKIEQLLTQFSLLQNTNEETVSLEEGPKGAGSEKSNMLKELADRVTRYLEILPADLRRLDRNEKLISNPLFRFLEREVTVLSKLLSTVRKVLTDVQDFALGRAAPVQETKKIAQNVMLNEIPKFWRKYIVPETVTLSNWIKDLKSRIEQLSKLSTTNDWQRKGLNIGELLFPEAFITATRQYVANKNQVSMDELQLRVSFADAGDVDDNSFLVDNIWIEGVNWTRSGIELTNEMSTHLSRLKFTWVKCQPADIKRLDKGEMFVPLYLNSTRRNLILSFKMDISQSSVSEKLLYQRGIALIIWKI